MTKYNQLIQALDNTLQAGDWRNVLLAITNEVIELFKDPKAKAVVFGSPEIDRCCLAAGELAWQSVDPVPLPPFDRQTVVYLATELYHKSGGHTLALKDVIRAQPDYRHVILLTNLHDKVLDVQGVASDMEPVPEFRVAPPGDVADKTLWLHSQLRSLRPKALMLFQHHYDAVAIAGALPQVAQDTFYFHHCDSDMAVGVYIPHSYHVDCTNISFENCRDRLGVVNQVYWPLVSQDLGRRAEDHIFMKGDTLTTCSHGSHNKFLSSGRYAYFDLIELRLREVSGIHFHIGYMPEEVINEFIERLTNNGIDPTRFKYIPPVSSLWTYLRDSEIDLCISSFPIQGGKGIVETMGAGFPVLIQQSSLAKIYSTRDISYEQGLWWSNPGQFIAALKSLTPELLNQHAHWSRKHYEKWHHPRELAYAVSNGRYTATPPPTHPFSCDTLALYYR